MRRLSLERGEFRRMSGSHTCLSMAHQLVGEREFSQIVPNHFCFYVEGVPYFAGVALDHRPHHFRNHNAVSEVGSHRLRLLTRGAFLLGLAQLLQKALILLLDSLSCESALLAGAKELLDLVDFEIEEIMQLNAPKHLLLETFLLLRLSFHFSKESPFLSIKLIIT